MIIEELESLSKRTTNIPAHNIRIRDEICAHIDCSEKELVFAGELLQVTKEESRWEAAIEKLLHNFALCLLVPPDLYQKEIGLQMILVTPMDKINIVEDYIASVHITEKHNDNTSRLLNITIERYQKEKERVTTSGIL